MNIFVTGASGFIGKEFSINANNLNNVFIKAITRKYINNLPKEIDQIIVPDINSLYSLKSSNKKLRIE